MAAFDAATALVPVDRERDTWSWTVDLDPDWRVAGRLNGGYLLAVLGRAALALVGDEHPAPVAASAHFLSAPAVGAARVSASVLRSGRTSAQVRTTLTSGGRPCIEAVITCGRLDGEVWWDGVEAPHLPPEYACPRLPVDAPGFQVPLMAVLSERLDPACLGWTAGTPGGRGELSGWLRFDDGREPDALSLLLAVDALPPATFDLGLGGWVPTLELTVHVRAVPAPGPLRVRQRARLVAGGRVDEECDVWDSIGRLVATGHQLAAVRVPEPSTPTTTPTTTP